MPSRLKQLQKDPKRTTTPSDLLSDLHIYIVPMDKWIPFRRLARNQVVEETVSAGFVRVSPTSTLLNLRLVLQQQLELDIPKYYVFIRSVGRNFTQVKAHQEQLLKVKHFLPPQAQEPEIHVLEISQDLIRESGSIPNLILSDTEMSDSQGPNSVRTGRISQVGMDGNVFIDSSGTTFHLGAPPLSYHEGMRSMNSYNADSRMGLTSRCHCNIQENDAHNPKMRRHTTTIARPTNVDEGQGETHLKDRHRSLSYAGKVFEASKRLCKETLKTSQAESGHSSEEEDTKQSFPSRKRGDTRVSRKRTNLNGRQRSSSVGRLPRSFSQESLVEESDGTHTRHRGRSRRMNNSTQREPRSLSVSDIERKRRVSNRTRGHPIRPNEITWKTLQENRELYYPHRWMLQRAARRKARELETELAEMREAKKLEEAQKFEKQIKKEEELLRRKGKLKSSQKTTEILNLEDSSDEVNVRISHKDNRIMDLSKSANGVTESETQGGTEAVGEKNGPSNTAFEISFADENDEENEETKKPKGEMQENLVKLRGGRQRRGRGKGRRDVSSLKSESQNNTENKNTTSRKGNKNRTTKHENHKESDEEAEIDNDRLKSSQEMETVNGADTLIQVETTKLIENKTIKETTKPNENKTIKETASHKSKETDPKTKERRIRKTNEIESSSKNNSYTKSSHESQNLKEAWKEADNEKPLSKIPKPENLHEQKQQQKNFVKNISSDHNIDEAPSKIPKAENLHEPKQQQKNLVKNISSSSVNKRMMLAAHEKGKNMSNEDIDEVRRQKIKYEEQRTYLFGRARSLHEQILNLKEKKRQKWWEEYNQARRKGVRLEERQVNLRQELEGLYRRVIGTLMRSQPLVTGVKDEPSRKASYKISVIRLRHEVADLLRRVEAIDIKLEAEMRLRQQANKEVKQLRSEVSRKKANVALSQSRAPLLRNIAYIPDDILIRL